MTSGQVGCSSLQDKSLPTLFSAPPDVGSGARVDGAAAHYAEAERPCAPGRGTRCAVLTVRCTKKLLDRLKITPSDAPLTSSTRLGDWYGRLLYTKPKQLVLFASEKSLLPVVVEAAHTATLLPRFRAALGDVFRALGIDGSAVKTELAAMEDAIIAKTNSRQILGSINDFVFGLGFHLRAGDSLHQASLKLAESPCSPLAMKSPVQVTRELLG